VQGPAPQLTRVLPYCDCVQVGKQIQTFRISLLCNPVPQCSAVIAKMYFASRLNS